MVVKELVPYLKDPSGQEHRLVEAVTSLGRAVDNDIVITSKRVSREHARIQREGRRLLLADVDSANGTYLNDERVLAPVALRDGDRIEFGSLAFEVYDAKRLHQLLIRLK